MKGATATAKVEVSGGSAVDAVRGTQTFVHTLSACWGRPSLTAFEVIWRWVFGVPALALCWFLVVPVVLGILRRTGWLCVV